jgi:hypothetical protein
MSKTKMSDLREHLFDVLERLKDPEPETPMNLDTAKAIIGVAETIIDSARAENDYLVALSKLYANGNPGEYKAARSSLFLLKSGADE